ncbi:MAG: hypothetical protein KGL95_09150, partial [Patescibacteria group bacterium]|nr:hypothetical protein [Patescibacteria group bacterium]
AVINVNSGTPVASISANNGNNSTYLTGNGTLGTTNFQNLTLGSPTTGSIILNNIAYANAGLNVPTGQNLTLSGITGNNSVLYSNTGTVTGLTTSTPNLCLLSGTSTPQWGTCALGTNYFQLNGNVISPYNTTLDLAIGGNSTSSALFQINGTTGNATTSGTLTFNNVPGVIQTTNVQNLTIGGLTTGQITLNGRNSSNTGITFAGYNNDQGILYTNTNGVVNQTAAPVGAGLCLLSAAAASSPTWGSCASGFNYWSEALGTLYPSHTNIDDLLLGSSSTSSAKFAFINVLTGTPTASISANNGNNSTYLTGNGTLGTTNFQNLTLGSQSTGSIFLSGLNGTNGGINFTGYGTGTLLSSSTGNITYGTLPLGNTSYVSGTLGIGNGGTGTNSTPTNGQLLIGNGT